MSNCSDALEKQRFNEIAGITEMSDEPLYINVHTNEKERTITIFDSGVGMTEEDAIANLGTIAKSGSKEFIESQGDSVEADNIIGQFGIGFYSTFIVADHVEVLTKHSNSKEYVQWESDGSGDFEISHVTGVTFPRGTQVKLHLKPECRAFSKSREVEKILKKFSMFITHPIKLNGEVINSLQALWYRDRRDVSEDEYEKFFENIANTKIPAKYRLHYSTDVPLAIKALLFFPSQNPEKFSMTQAPSKLHLYSRKVLIKENATELLPSYLRFIKGIVDCEDLPLNISRETYQDSHLLTKIKNVLTRRVLKVLEDEMKLDGEKYDNWYKEFGNNLKEGLHGDADNAQQILKLLRFKSSISAKNISIEDYVQRMNKDQKKIYFLVQQDMANVNSSPFLEPFKSKNAPPVIFVESHIDEMCFRQINEFKGMKFVNIETNFEEIAKDVDTRVAVDKDIGLPEADTTSFCLWIKQELAPYVGKVTISKRLTATPAVIVGDVSASMRIMMKMMEQGENPNPMDHTKDQQLEINPNHPLITKLNKLRKTDHKAASIISKQVLDNIFMNAGLPIDTATSMDRSYGILLEYLD